MPAAKRLFLIVRGPAPSCRVVGVVPVRGRAGENVVRFRGRVAGRLLERGTYLLTISPRRRVVTQAQTEAVRVVSPRRTVPLPDTAREPECPAEQALASAATARALLLESRRATKTADGPTAGSLGERFGPTAPLRPPSVTPPTASPQDGLPEATPFPGVLAPPDGAEGSGAAATIAAFAVVGLLLLAMAVLVTRFLRGSWNP